MKVMIDKILRLIEMAENLMNEFANFISGGNEIP